MFFPLLLYFFVVQNPVLQFFALTLYSFPKPFLPNPQNMMLLVFLSSHRNIQVAVQDHLWFGYQLYNPGCLAQSLLFLHAVWQFVQKYCLTKVKIRPTIKYSMAKLND